MSVPLGDTYYFKFTTRDSTGAPTTLSGTPVISVYEEGNLTQITAGITLTVDYDSVTGLNDVAIVATSGNGYEVGKYYDAVITTGTVGGTSVVGETVKHFRMVPAEDAGAGIPDVNLTHWLDTAAATPSVAGVPEVDITHTSGVTEDIATKTKQNTAQADLDIITRSVIMNSTTIATMASQTSFTLTGGSADDGAYGHRAIVIVTDSATTTQKAVGVMDTYTGATKTVALVRDPGVFTMAVGDIVDIIPSPAEHVLDEVTTGSTHNVANSFGKRIRDLQEFGTYEGGAIFIDSVNGSAGTTNYESGTNLNPVTGMSDANTLASSLTLSRFEVAPVSSITFAASQTGQIFKGAGYTLALGGQDISNTHIEGAAVSGIATAPTGIPIFYQCIMNNVTLPPCTVSYSTFEGTLTLGSAGESHLHNTHCGNLSTGCVIDFGVAVGDNSLAIHNWSGIVDFQNMGQLGTDFVGIGGKGIVTINANCVGGTIHIHGDMEVTDNSGGAVTIIYDDNTTNIQGIIEDTADMQPKLGTPAGASISADIAAISTLLTTTGVALTASERDSVAAAILAYNMGNSRTVKEALAFLRNKWTIAGTTLTVYDTDDTSVLWTSTVVQTARDPVSSSDPA